MWFLHLLLVAQYTMSCLPGTTQIILCCVETLSVSLWFVNLIIFLSAAINTTTYSCSLTQQLAWEHLRVVNSQQSLLYAQAVFGFLVSYMYLPTSLAFGFVMVKESVLGISAFRELCPQCQCLENSHRLITRNQSSFSDLVSHSKFLKQGYAYAVYAWCDTF